MPGVRAYLERDQCFDEGTSLMYTVGGQIPLPAVTAIARAVAAG